MVDVEQQRSLNAHNGPVDINLTSGPYRSAAPSNDDLLLQRLLADLSWTALLTRREREVLAATVRGLDTKVTAVELGISPKTVDEMWRRIFRKTGCRSRVEVLSRLLASSFQRLSRK